MTTHIKNILTDLTKTTSGLSFDIIKVTGTEEKTEFKSMSEDGTIIMKAKTKDVVPEFEGTFGLSNLKILSGYLSIFNSYDKDENVVVEVNSSERNGTDVKTDITFRADKRSKANYRLVGENGLKKILVAKSIEWNAAINELSRKKIGEFEKFSGVLSSTVKKFSVSEDDGVISFTIGDDSGAVSSAVVEMGEVDDGNLSSSFKYPISEVKTVLGNDSPKLKFSDKGFMMISVDTGLIEYEFIFRGGN